MLETKELENRKHILLAKKKKHEISKQYYIVPNFSTNFITKRCDKQKLIFALLAPQLQSNGTYRSHQWIDETGSNAGTNIPDRQNESSGSPFLVRHVGQRQVSLGHADGQWTKALSPGKQKQEKSLCEEGTESSWDARASRLLLPQHRSHLLIIILNLLFGFWRQLNIISSIHSLSNRSDFLHYGQLWEDLEAGEKHKLVQIKLVTTNSCDVRAKGSPGDDIKSLDMLDSSN